MQICKMSIHEGDDSATVGERQPDPRGERSYELVTSGASTNWPSAPERGAHLVGERSTNAALQEDPQR